MKLDAEGRLFVTASRTSPVGESTDAEGSPVWVSADHGATWTRATLPPSSGERVRLGTDQDLAIDARGDVYHLRISMLSTSGDHGVTWAARSPAPLANAPAPDRPWLAPDARAAGTLHVLLQSLPVCAYNNVGSVPLPDCGLDNDVRQLSVTTTRDGGMTWSGPAIASARHASVCADAGPLVSTRSGFMFGYLADDGIHLAALDTGTTAWADTLVAGSPGDLCGASYVWVFALETADGARYVTWARRDADGSNSIAYVRMDQGAPGPVRTALSVGGDIRMAWAVAGDAGRLGYCWYQTSRGGGATLERAAILVGADSDAPSLTVADVASAPVAGAPPGGWSADFQSCAADPTDGALVVAYDVVPAGKAPGGSTVDGTTGVVTLSRQLAGPRLFEHPVTSGWVS